MVDDGSTDGTGEQAAAAGGHVIRRTAGPGEGEALRCAISHTSADIVVFLDGDVVNFPPWFVVALAAPLIDEPATMMVKAGYERPLHGWVGEGGRVTELLARPLLERFFRALASIVQPLAGEFALRRKVLADIALDDGYAIDIGLLIDVYEGFGREAIIEVDLGERIHRNRPLHELRPHSRAVLDAVLTPCPAHGTGSRMVVCRQPRIELLVTVISPNSRPGGHIAPSGSGRSPAGWLEAR